MPGKDKEHDLSRQSAAQAEDEHKEAPKEQPPYDPNDPNKGPSSDVPEKDDEAKEKKPK